MSKQFWTEQIAWAVADGAAVANSTTETIIFPDVTIPANYMADGRTLRLTLFGRHGTNTATTPTMTFRVRWGGVAGVLLCQSGAMVTGSGVTAAMWELEIILQTRSNGSTGTIFAVGRASLHEDATSTVGSATNSAAVDLMGSAGVATPAAVTVDLTADKALSVTCQWGTANANNTLTGHVYTLESMN